jgi:hypothetical protein
MPKTYYLDDNFLNAALRGIPFVPPAAVYVALFTSTPDASGVGTEVVGGGYDRQLATFTVPENGEVRSTADVLFPVAQALWGTITSFGFVDAISGGNLLYFGALSSPRLVDVSDQVRFGAGNLLCQES